jgi:hypothetical protein
MTLTSLLDFIARLAPFSVVIAVLALLNNYRQAEQRRRDERVQRTRELLSKLGTAAYVVAWTSLLGESDVEVALLRIRDELQRRLGSTPTAEAIRDVLADQRLREAMVHEGFSASGSNARVEEQVKEFARLRSEITFHNSALEMAMDEIEGHLRVRLLRALNVAMALRDEHHVLRAGIVDESGKMHAPLAYAHWILRNDAEIPRQEGLSEALKVIEALGDLVVRAPDSTVRRLYARPRAIRRVRRWIQRRRRARAAARKYAELRLRIRQRAGSDSDGLGRAIDFVIAEASKVEDVRLELAAASANFARLAGTAASRDLVDAIAAFCDARSQDKRHLELECLLEFKAQGVDDPDIDVFLAAASGVVPLLESALVRGGNPNVGILTVIKRHRREPEDASGDTRTIG